MTDRTAFTDAEWDLLVRLPRWVAFAAAVAQDDGALGRAAEDEAGLIAIANGRSSASPLVAAVATALVDTFDEPDRGPAGERIDFRKAPAAIAMVLQRAQEAAGLLAAKAAPDAAAYRRWLLTISHVVVGAARSGSVLGIGGEMISAAERRFEEQLSESLRSAG